MSGDIDFVLAKHDDASRILADHPNVLERWPGKTWHWLCQSSLSYLYEILSIQSKTKLGNTYREFLLEFKTLARKESEEIDEELSAMSGLVLKGTLAYVFEFPDQLKSMVAALDEKDFEAIAQQWNPKLSPLSGPGVEILRGLSTLCRDATAKRLSILAVDNCLY